MWWKSYRDFDDMNLFELECWKGKIWENGSVREDWWIGKVFGEKGGRLYTSGELTDWNTCLWLEQDFHDRIVCV